MAAIQIPKTRKTLMTLYENMNHSLQSASIQPKFFAPVRPRASSRQLTRIYRPKIIRNRLPLPPVRRELQNDTDESFNPIISRDNEIVQMQNDKEESSHGGLFQKKLEKAHEAQ